MITAATLPIPVNEYRLLHKIYLESLEVRDKGVMAFNRLPPAMRLAIVSLALHYREQGYNDSGTPRAGRS